MSTTFPAFVAHFPPVSMPATLGEETHHVFFKENKALPFSLISEYILPVEGIEGEDEYTEFVPCFAVDDTDNFIALVWWKATLLNYEYRLATYSLKGELIDHKIIAFTRVHDQKVERRVATINEEWEITMAEGASRDGDADFDPTTAKTVFAEIMPNGQIVDG